MFEEIAILAPGLLGGSLLLASHERTLAQRLSVWARREQTRTQCQETGCCHAVHAKAEEAVSAADLVILCAPVNAIPTLLETIAPSLKPGAIVTDVGSTKTEICSRARALMPAHSHFIGAHPMAGSEKNGMQHADAALFTARPCILTPYPDTPAKPLAQLHAFWKALGMQVHQSTPQEHDLIVAHISHLPHLLAAVLCKQLADKPESWLELAGQGLRDTTRVAAGDTALWQAIFVQNRQATLAALREYREQLDHAEQLLESRNDDAFASLLEQARQTRNRF